MKRLSKTVSYAALILFAVLAVGVALDPARFTILQLDNSEETNELVACLEHHRDWHTMSAREAVKICVDNPDVSHHDH